MSYAFPPTSSHCRACVDRAAQALRIDTCQQHRLALRRPWIRLDGCLSTVPMCPRTCGCHAISRKSITTSRSARSTARNGAASCSQASQLSAARVQTLSGRQDRQAIQLSGLHGVSARHRWACRTRAIVARRWHTFLEWEGVSIVHSPRRHSVGAASIPTSDWSGSNEVGSRGSADRPQNHSDPCRQPSLESRPNKRLKLAAPVLDQYGERSPCGVVEFRLWIFQFGAAA